MDTLALGCGRSIFAASPNRLIIFSGPVSLHSLCVGAPACPRTPEVLCSVGQHDPGDDQEDDAEPDPAIADYQQSAQCARDNGG
jgi:hypothetical protein